jgi:hypothetical protein
MYADEPTPETHFVNNGGVTVGYDKLINGFRSNNVQIFNRVLEEFIEIYKLFYLNRV